MKGMMVRRRNLDFLTLRDGVIVGRVERAGLGWG
jgi:hypothetical protein